MHGAGKLLSSDELFSRICDAGAAHDRHVLLKTFSYETRRQNQFLFFLKPEVLLLPEPEHRLEMVQAAFKLFDQYEVEIAGCMVISGSSLAKVGVMERHYGTINLLSRRASTELSDAEASAIRKLVDAPEDARIVGGHEYLDLEGVTPLYETWQPQESIRVRSGFYVQGVQTGIGPMVLVNGFHPAHLANFLDVGHQMVLFLLNSDSPWSILRSHMLGDTFPERAYRGSLRGIFRDRAPRFGLGPIDTRMNCAHMSAGPFEALFEMKNFLASEVGIEFRIDQANLVKLMTKRNLAQYADLVLQNPHAERSPDLGRLFNVSEGVDSISAINLFRVCYMPRAADREKRNRTG